jgi:hypothetical protein
LRAQSGRGAELEVLRDPASLRRVKDQGPIHGFLQFFSVPLGFHDPAVTMPLDTEQQMPDFVSYGMA